MVRTFAAAAALTIAGSALAVPTGAHWVQVDNSANANQGAGTGFDASWCTYDLYVDFEAGDVVSAADFGIAGPNAGLSTDGTFFQVGPPFGGDSYLSNLGFAAFFPNVEYDTAIALGGSTPSFAQAMAWNEGGVTGAWFNTTPTAASPSLHLARVTVNIGATFLGGQIFVTGNGPSGEFGTTVPSTGVVNIPNAKVPTPGALALFGLAGAAATRRRR
ncbi:MAG: hypothetical protein H6813_04670 [Phycisphaeraceae bacterium]|nr:hypothetical protein [Phycisphaeraceae bacterium]MCB9847243.1 hypothetical protein [Phycisphaeraceae bacterium]